MIGRAALPLILFLFLVLPVHALVPVGVEHNNDIGSAGVVDDPARSVLLFGSLDRAGDAAYYNLTLRPGERLVLSIVTPGTASPAPSAILSGPDIPPSPAGIPPGVILPPGEGAVLIPGHSPTRALFDPAGPGVLFGVANLSEVFPSGGVCHVTIIAPANGTRYGLVVGYREEFTPLNWILVPLTAIDLFAWEGQLLPEILAPGIAILVLGFIVIFRRVKRQGKSMPVASWLASLAGLFLLGGAAVTAVQIARAIRILGLEKEVVVSITLVLIAVGLALWALRIGRKPGPGTLADRAALAAIGCLALVCWAGLVAGPVLALAAALAPDH